MDPHTLLVSNLQRALNRNNVRFLRVYTDPAENTQYHTVYGKAIKFWNISPKRGDNLDKAILEAGELLSIHDCQIKLHRAYDGKSHIVSLLVEQL